MLKLLQLDKNNQTRKKDNGKHLKFKKKKKIKLWSFKDLKKSRNNNKFNNKKKFKL